MRNCDKRIFVGLPLLSLLLACSANDPEGDTAVSGLASLMDDGQPAAVSPSNTAADFVAERYCTDCAGTPLAFWKFDFCRAQSTELEDSANSTATLHPAF